VRILRGQVAQARRIPPGHAVQARRIPRGLAAQRQIRRAAAVAGAAVAEPATPAFLALPAAAVRAADSGGPPASST
jgi:hypothetical protein